MPYILDAISFFVFNDYSQKTIAAAWTKAGTLAKWTESAWAKKMASQKVRANLTDFDRFKLMIARKNVCIFVPMSNFLSFKLFRQAGAVIPLSHYTILSRSHCMF